MRFQSVSNIINDNYDSLYQSQTIIPKDFGMHVNKKFLITYY